MKRRFLGWSLVAGTSFVLLAPIVACESDTASDMSFNTNTTAPDVGVYVAPSLPDAAPVVEQDAHVDAPVESAPPPACDDGKVDPNETCDPLASCPTACPAVQCQLRTLEGIGTCGAKCTDGNIQTACINGDSCCPAGNCNKTNDDDCAAICGNSVVEPGELCDGTSCPSSCPALGCQLRTLQGAGTCQAQCVNSGTQALCVNGDSCCPTGCNANNDTDCGPGCGNKVLEAGETCDPVDSCPTDCPQLGCQLRQLVNSGTCQAQCVNAGNQAECINGDGCCPSACNANNDNDCKPSCGNGTVEKGEACDPLASCPESCPQINCQLFKLTNAGTCQAACVTAGQQSACVSNDGCCPKGCNANNDSDCPAACGNGVVEKGETCDPPSSCPTCRETYSCYGSTGSAATCDLVCHVPVTKCGAKADACCPFNGAGGCNLKTDSECTGGGWKWLQWPSNVDTSKGCVTVDARNIFPGASYEITTCAPPGASTGSGDPSITQVIDNSQVNYGVGNDNCSDATALPNLAGSECHNKAGQLTMACASPSPGGFIAGSKASAFFVTVCAATKAGMGSTPLFIWYNAPEAPALAN